MKSILSKFVLAPAVLAAAALAATSANAETTVKVPFNFTVGNKVLPAGNYTVNKDSGNFVTLIRRGSSDIYTWILGPGAPEPNDSKVALNFDLIGGSHVLQSIQYGPAITARLDKKSLQESERESTRLSGGR
jgi:hypothetical protein